MEIETILAIISLLLTILSLAFSIIGFMKSSHAKILLSDLVLPITIDQNLTFRNVKSRGFKVMDNNQFIPLQIGFYSIKSPSIIETYLGDVLLDPTLIVEVVDTTTPFTFRSASMNVSSILKDMNSKMMDVFIQRVL